MANTKIDRPLADGIAFENFRGLRNDVEPSKFELGELADALNVDIDDALALKLRRGQALVLAGSSHSLWSDGTRCFAVVDNDLVELDPDLTPRTIHEGMTPHLPVAYATIPGRAFWSNGRERGCVDVGGPRGWGLDVPAAPVVTETGGSLQAGVYQVAVRPVRSTRVSGGASRAATLEIDADRGLEIVVPALVDGAAWYELYVSTVGGEILYYVGDVDGGETVVYRAVRPSLGRPLEGQFLRPPPAGTSLLAMGGYMLVAKGNALHISEPFHAELFDPRKVLGFSADITGLALVDDGVFVGHPERITWLAGRDPAAWAPVTTYASGIVPGSIAYGPGEDLGDGVPSIVPFAMTPSGPVAMLPGGQVKPLTTGFVFPRQERAAGVVRELRGISQFVCTLQGTERA